jgi:hypothetical protein
VLAGFRCKGGRDGDLEGEVGWFSIECGGYSPGDSDCDVEGGGCGIAVLIAS